MSVEVNCYRFKRQGEDILEESISVAPGDFDAVHYHNIRVVTFCDIADEIARIWVKGKYPKRKFQAVLYEDETDKEGVRVHPDPEKPFKLKDGQMLSLSLRMKPKKEVFVYMDQDDEGDEDFNEVPSDPGGILMPV